MSPVWPRVTRAYTLITVIARASTCAIGRNISIELPGRVSWGNALMSARTSASMLRCVSTQPLGRPVVPEV